MLSATIRHLSTSLCAVALLGVIAGCGGPVTFQGQSALAVVGTPPAPPPPPPPPPPEPPPPPPPPEPPARVEVRDNKIQINEKIQFEYNKATIKEESFSLMNEIADVIQKNPHIKKIAIEGHASAEGNKQYNKTLSDKRAKAVMKYLTEKGIAAEMLTAAGFGSEKPISENDTEEGREKNRRVEFNIVEQDITKKKVEIDSKGSEKVLSEEKAVEKKVEPAPPPEEKKDPKKKAPKKAPEKAAPTPPAPPATNP